MTKKRLEMLNEVLEMRRKEMGEQIKEAKVQVKEMLENIIGMDNVKVTSVSTRYEGWACEVSVVDEDDKRIFGADMDVYYDEEKGVEVNYGCCGSFDKDNQPQIDKAVMTAKVVQAFDEIREGFENISIDRVKAYHEAEREVYSAEFELHKEYEEEFEKGLAVDKTYKVDGDEWTITKLTPKYVTYTSKRGDGLVYRERKTYVISELVRAKMNEKD